MFTSTVGKGAAERGSARTAGAGAPAGKARSIRPYVARRQGHERHNVASKYDFCGTARGLSHLHFAVVAERYTARRQHVVERSPDVAGTLGTYDRVSLRRSGQCGACVFVGRCTFRRRGTRSSADQQVHDQESCSRCSCCSRCLPRPSGHPHGPG